MRQFQFFFSLRSKLFLAFFSVSAIIAIALTYSLYSHMRADHINTLSRELMNIAAVVSLQVDGDVLEQMVSPEQESLPQYSNIKKQLSTIASQIPDIKYIYTMRKTHQPGQYAFIVDADSDPESVAHIGELYDGTSAPAIEAGFIGPSADQQFITDKWGTLLSGFAPVRNSNNEVVAIVGIDIDADTMMKGLADFTRNIIYQSVVVIMLCALFIFIVANGFSRRFQLINKAVDEIASGNCDIVLKVDGQDAIAHLSARINNLAATLHGEREEMLMSTIKVLVNALEAKDKYTSGHSSEVECLCIEICKVLSLPEEDRFKVAIAATLHDIGKIGIPDLLLHKQGKFTEEEWFQIRQHPSIGAAIIDGITSLHDVSQIVMHHHARWDGKGYPEPLSGHGIPLGSRIIAVADSFQAMISDRPYRKGMPIEDALTEIKRCAGTQFDPEIVEAFLLTKTIKKSTINKEFNR